MPKAATKLDRIQWSILAATALVGLGLGVALGPKWGAGGVAGGIVGYLNFRWLRATVVKLLGEGRGKAWAGFVYSFKLALIAAVLAGLIYGLGIPALAVLGGLGSMPAGIIGETIWESATGTTDADS